MIGIKNRITVKTFHITSTIFTTQKRFQKLGLKSICIVALVVFFMSGIAYAEPEKSPSQYIVLSSHAGKHLTGKA